MVDSHFRVSKIFEHRAGDRTAEVCEEDPTREPCLRYRVASAVARRVSSCGHMRS